MTNAIPDNSPIINQVNRLRAAQERNEGAELERLIRAYAAIHDKALAKAELLAADMAKIDGPISKDKLMRMRRYRELMAETQAELEKYKNFLEVEIGTASRTAIAAGEIDARNLTSTTLRMMGVNARINAINPAVIEQLIGFLEPDGPLWKRISGLPGYTAEQVSQAIIEGVGLGRNPRTIARDITRTMGMGLTDSMRMMRTAQLYGYREANRASYVANKDVVEGWIWYAQLDSFTCGSCWAMHGTVHSLDEVLDDHHNGRCSMVPMVPGFPNDVTPGVDQFEQLSEEKQRAVLGKSKWQAWKEGKFTLSDITGIRADEVYGDMRIERSLKDLLKNKAIKKDGPLSLNDVQELSNELTERYGFPKTFVGTTDDWKIHAARMGGGIEVNLDMLNAKSTIWEGGAPRNAAEIITHEFGHIIQTTLTLDEKYFGYGLSRPGMYYERGQEPGNNLARQLMNLSKTEMEKVSEYATKNDLEYFAESFVLYNRGKDYHDRIYPNLLDLFKRLDKK